MWEPLHSKLIELHDADWFDLIVLKCSQLKVKFLPDTQKLIQAVQNDHICESEGPSQSHPNL